ncbi:MAG: hypothetical protein K2U26_01825 [Cyclobacteriaceae bacterium]|nr:hypothetical protein [Cyclobacteriaceae bacterium]
MQLQRYGGLLIFGLCAHFAVGQTLPNSLDPGKKNVFHAPSTSKKEVKSKKVNVKHTARYEFYERVEQAAREKQKILKQLSKRQFSDHRHFGHKRPPKRRAPHKMRYCNECGIRH